MMTRQEYLAMANEAFERYNRLLATVPQAEEIVFVLSREVYQAMLAYDYEPPLAATVDGAHGMFGLYTGVRICCINEDHEGLYFMPVPYSRNFTHYAGVGVDDYVVFNDDDNDLLFKLARITPAQYIDTGLTVSFVEALPTNNANDAAVDAAAVATAQTTDAVDALTYAGIPINDYAGGAATVAADGVTLDLDFGREIQFDPDELNRIVDAFIRAPREVTFTANNAYVNTTLLEQLAGVGSTPKRKRRAVKEEELNPGNTKMIDDFLNSFVRSGA